MTRRREEPRHRPGSPSTARIWRYFWRAMLPAFAAVVAPALVGFAHSDFFLLREVVVRASDLGLAEEVAAFLEVPAGANTLFYPLRELVAQAERRPRVLSARVGHGGHDRLIVKIREREPAFALQSAQSFVLADREGVLLFQTGRPGPNRPVVLGAQDGKRPLGSRLNAECLATVLECMSGAEEAGLGLNLILDLGTRYDYKLETPSGVLVKLGGPDNLARKIVIAASIERHLQERNARAEYIDVRAPGRPPTWRPAAKTDADKAST